MLHEVRFQRKEEASSQGRDRREITTMYQTNLPIVDENYEKQNEKQCKQEHLEDLFRQLQRDPKARYPLSNNWADVPGLHPNTKAALWSQPPAPIPHHMKALHIFVDGSSKKQGNIEQAAWAYVVLVESENQHDF